MNRLRLLIIYIPALLLTLLLLGPLRTMLASSGLLLAKEGIAFTIRHEEGRYIVAMRPNVTPPGEPRTLSAQVTFKVPHREGAERFVVADLQSAVADAIWVEAGRVDAPVEDPAADYLTFAFDANVIDSAAVAAIVNAAASSEAPREVPLANNLGAYHWRAGEEIQLFSFTNGAVGNGVDEGESVTLLEHDDPFLAPNSLGTNPLNQITILGLDAENAYIGNYSEASSRFTDIFLPFIRR